MATPTLPFKSVESRFMARTRDLYGNMTKRFAERKSKKGRITRVGQTVPFDLDALRAWLYQRLGGENGVVKCTYCAEWLSIDTLVVDHRVPTSQGGGLGFDNLDLVCKQDNDQKGGMCGDCYAKLLNWTADGTATTAGLHPACRQNMLHRLAIAVQLAAQKRWEIIRDSKKKQKEEDEGVF